MWITQDTVSAVSLFEEQSGASEDNIGGAERWNDSRYLAGVCLER